MCDITKKHKKKLCKILFYKQNYNILLKNNIKYL